MAYPYIARLCTVVLCMCALLNALAAHAADNPVAMRSGTITAISGASVTVQEGDMPAATYDVSATTKILIDGKRSASADLKPGLFINIAYTGSNATSIYARTTDADFWGKVSIITAASVTVKSSAGETRSFTVSPMTAVHLYTKAADISAVKAGLLADIKYSQEDDSTAMDIAIVRPDGGVFRGVITAVANGSVTLKDKDSAPVTFTVSPTASITVAAKTVKFDDLKVGQPAEITAADGETATIIIASLKPGKHPVLDLPF